MFWNYLLSAVRNAVRQKLYTFINLAGLTVGLTCVVLIALYLQGEITFDRWIPDSQNVYRVEISGHPPGQKPLRLTQSPLLLGPTMKAELPEVMAQTRFIPQKSTVSVGNRLFPEQVTVVDPEFFQVIQLPLVDGDAASVLRQPDAVVISETKAHKYFGDADPIGKLLIFDSKHSLRVAGVMRDLPYNTSLAGDIFIPCDSKADQTPPSAKATWFSFPGWTYVRLAPGADLRRVEAKVPGLFLRHTAPAQAAAMMAMFHASIDQFINALVVPLRDVHLTTDQYGGMKPAGSRTTVYGIAGIALLILLIACFNFTNLATARAMIRAREVGLRKVVGAKRRQLIVQFLGESVITALVALVLALAIVEVLLPAYGGFLGHTIEFQYLENWPLTLCVIGIAVLAGLLGGFYPARVLSGFRPAAALKPAAASQSGSGLLRMALVVFQFAISIGLGIAAIVVFAQIRYARHLDLGFDRDNMVIAATAPGLSPSATESFMHILETSPHIAGVAQSSTVPFSEELGDFTVLTTPGSQQRYTVRRVSISPEFPAVYGMKLLAGRLLSRDRGTDVARPGDHSASSSVIIDEDTALALGFTPQSALGKTVEYSETHGTIVGVVQNALFHGARAEAVTPVLYYFSPQYLPVLSIRLKGGHIPQALSFIDTTWHSFARGDVMQRQFLDDGFDKLFAADQKEGALIGLFVGIAIFIACLGLFGLAAFTAERRTKEIGIRKIMGARTNDIVRLLLWQFSIPVLVANVIAWPIAWYYLQHWLEGYAYRIELNPLYFAAAGLVALLIAWLTVIGHALRVARANPVHALRYE
jgi:putative ABC transport system permease protein